MKFKLLALLSAAVLLFGCEKYDDSGLKSDIDNLKSRVTALEQLCKTVNENVSSLQAIVTALQKNDYITGVTKLADDAGYTITFNSGKTITIHNGKNGVDGAMPRLKIENGMWYISYDNGSTWEELGKATGEDGEDGTDGHTPVISVKQDTDGVWYWTVDGEWLYADGKKVRVTGEEGEAGIAPKLKIEEGMWYVSYDDGSSWEQLGKATGADGASAGIISVTDGEDAVTFGMQDGTTIIIPKSQQLAISFGTSDVTITEPGACKSIVYTLTGASESTIVKSLAQDGWKAKVEPKDYKSGAITITAPNPLVESEVLVFVSDGDKTILAVLNCIKSTITMSQEHYDIEAAGGEIEITVQTNTDFSVSIPSDAKSWLSYVETKSESSKTIHLAAKPNTVVSKRNATVSLIDDSGVIIKTFSVIQSGDLTGLITIRVDTEGTLPSILESYDEDNIVKLKILGIINADDFTEIKLGMPALRYLDISEVNISELPDGCFEKSTNVTDIMLPSSLTSIPNYCFSESKIQNISFGENSQVLNIGEAAFASSPLKAITIPAYCETIGESAFVGCTALKSVTFEEGSRLKTICGHYVEWGEANSGFWSGAFSCCSALESITIPARCETIGAHAFYGCESLETVSLELCSQLKALSKRTFACCYALKSISLPSSLEVIGDYALACCESLYRITFGQEPHLNLIGEYAFRGCLNLNSITIPASCETIGSFAFFECESLRTVSFEAGSTLKTIGESAFRRTALKSIIIPASCETVAGFYICSTLESVTFEPDSKLKTIGRNAFSSTALKSIIIPASCETIEYDAFSSCKSFKDISFEPGSQLSTIQGSVFRGCSSLENVSFTNVSKLKSTGGYLFNGCTSLKSVTFPSCCETIGSHSFDECSSLESVTFESGSKLKSIGYEAFSGSGLKSITIPASCETIHDAFEDCTTLESITFEPNSKLKAIAYGAFSNTALKSITIPASCDTIHALAFDKCAALESVIFEPESNLKIIGYYQNPSQTSYGAFRECTALKSIVIPASCETIGAGAFYGCSSLTDLAFEYNSSLTSIGGYAFEACTLHRIDMQYCTKLSTISIGAFTGDDQIEYMLLGATKPPKLDNKYVYWGLGAGSVLKVPAGSVSAYKAADGWNYFASITALD